LNPFELPLGATRHELRVECEGYRPKMVVFTPSSDQTLDLSLERATPPAPRDPRRKR
jgi:hypothetical protein